jgi:hypothetical protein
MEPTKAFLYMKKQVLNYPVAGNAGVAPRLQLNPIVPGVPEPGCWPLNGMAAGF